MMKDEDDETCGIVFELLMLSQLAKVLGDSRNEGQVNRFDVLHTLRQPVAVT